MPSDDDRAVFIAGQLRHIDELVAKATEELGRGDLAGAHEATLLARKTYESLPVQIAKISGEYEERQALSRQLGEANEAIARAERRLTDSLQNER